MGKGTVGVAVTTLQDYLTVTQAAARKGVTHQAIRLAIAEGRLRASRLGGHWVIHRDDLAQYEPNYAPNTRKERNR